MTETTYTESDLDQATAAYIETMLWASCPMTEDGSCDYTFEYLNYTSEDDCTDALVASCREAVKAFLDDIDAEGLLAICEDEGKSYEGLGHDFWLTRNGHGAGFWDGDYTAEMDDGTDLGEALTKAAKSFGSGHADLYIEGADEHGDGGLVTE